jgi:hypothetical protein
VTSIILQTWNSKANSKAAAKGRKRSALATKARFRQLREEKQNGNQKVPG